MTATGAVRRAGGDLLTAVQFLTRVPVPAQPFASDSVARSAVFFPLVGLGIGVGAGGLDVLLAPHVGRWSAAVATVVFLVLVTGCLHEDAMADAADGFGGGWTREQTLRIMKDSRIGSYGATALVLSLLGRVVLLATMPIADVLRYAIAAEVLCRWTPLPLGYFLPPAGDGQGARLAVGSSRGVLVAGSALTLVIVGATLRMRAVGPGVAAALVAAGTGWFYRRRIGGVTGDCFGATVGLTEIAVLACGAWQT